MSSPAETSRGLRPLIPVVVLLGVMWLLEILDAALPGDLDQFGIESRDVDGLTGVAASPFLHADFAHLMANTVPFLILGSIVALRKPRRFWPIVITITVVGGFAVWLLGPTNTVTIGASGVVFGLLTYLITAGILTRHWLDVVIAVGVLFVYGGILIGALPFGVSSGVSWLAHLTGAAAGVLAAFLFARQPDGVVHVPQ
ncbi:MAG: rhomboid family intramembrane serine protease [Actinobacteria bacterium]|nr:rhomboid family intramembrane serine protease [Micrococcales bacterium]MCB9428925.1 rhomboid family intramembrane serine protease [Actinomycetota bacterium]MCO5298745.1 rhomboid family intramembrane serine protease [Candidatus Nanopelagicales bacterium]HPE13505.1 rhomboid family intramembrane serine protease [Actinomycetota bacterium]HRV66848.1 rhomboid family intramembrane serine protease [Candidatus Nanopelagicales bacterium]